jgi:hypothetical protein
MDSFVSSCIQIGAAKICVARMDVLMYIAAHPHSIFCKRWRTSFMDRLHRKPQASDFRTGRDCSFCARFDPQFTKRDSLDRLVEPRLDDKASAHLTEDGYVKHRLAELSLKMPLPRVLAKSA